MTFPLSLTWLIKFYFNHKSQLKNEPARKSCTDLSIVRFWYNFLRSVHDSEIAYFFDKSEIEYLSKGLFRIVLYDSTVALYTGSEKNVNLNVSELSSKITTILFL